MLKKIFSMGQHKQDTSVLSPNLVASGPTAASISHLPEKLKMLLQEQPKFHAIYDDVTLVEEECCNWSIDQPILEWIVANVKPGFASLETGCGYSSVAFALAGARHTVLSPIAAEHEAIQRWCVAQAIDLGSVEFLAQASQDVIHSLPQTPLDVVLIDGCHGFPIPFIDWYYTAERLKEGGMMLVDDTQIITGKILKDFLTMEDGRWSVAAEFGKTTVFRRVTSESVTRGLWFGLQPYCRELVG